MRPPNTHRTLPFIGGGSEKEEDFGEEVGGDSFSEASEGEKGSHQLERLERPPVTLSLEPLIQLIYTAYYAYFWSWTGQNRVHGLRREVGLQGAAIPLRLGPWRPFSCPTSARRPRTRHPLPPYLVRTARGQHSNHKLGMNT